MKTLNDYLKRAGAKSLTELSLEVGISKSRLSQLRNSTEWPPELALKIEQATAAALDASKLSAVVAQARAA